MVGTIRIAMLAAAAGPVVLAVLLSATGSPALTPLPKAQQKGKMSLEQALARRRSIRRFEPGKLTRPQIAQLCWAAQGVSDPERGLRYSWGYGACPDHLQHRLVFELLPARERLGMELTVAGALVPEVSTAALVVHHPEARYFSV